MKTSPLTAGIVCTFVFLTGISIGYGVREKFTEERPSQINSRLDSPTYRFTNPLLDEESFNKSLLNREIRNLKQSLDIITLEAIQNNLISNGSVYYRDLNNGPWILTDEQHDYTPASLFKIPLMIAFFSQAERNPAILEKNIIFDTPLENAPLHNVDSSSESIVIGQTYTVASLIERMIIYSDNQAAYLLLKHIDSSAVSQVFHDLDVPMEGVEKTIAPFGPRTYASFLRVLYNGTYLSKENSERALEILSRSTFSHGMRSALSKDTLASIKYGIAVNQDGTKQLHECGIIYADRNPYVLCIMTEGWEYEKMITYIKAVTAEIYKTAQ